MDAYFGIGANILGTIVPGKHEHNLGELDTHYLDICHLAQHTLSQINIIAPTLRATWCARIASHPQASDLSQVLHADGQRGELGGQGGAQDHPLPLHPKGGERHLPPLRAH